MIHILIYTIMIGIILFLFIRNNYEKPKSKLISKVIVDTNEYILMSIEFEEGYKAGWEELQELKDKHYNELVFVETYPKKTDIINKANVRHLYHVKGNTQPTLKNLENENINTTIHIE